MKGKWREGAGKVKASPCASRTSYDDDVTTALPWVTLANSTTTKTTWGTKRAMDGDDDEDQLHSPQEWPIRKSTELAMSTSKLLFLAHVPLCHQIFYGSSSFTTCNYNFRPMWPDTSSLSPRASPLLSVERLNFTQIFSISLLLDAAVAVKKKHQSFQL